MATPSIASVEPASGDTSGGTLVRVVGRAFAPRVHVVFGEASAGISSTRAENGATVFDVRAPRSEPGVVDVVVENLNDDGAAVAGELGRFANAFRYARPRVAAESDLARLLRTLLRALKQQLLENVSAGVSVDYDDTPGDEVRVTALAKLPSIVLAGPQIRENRLYGENVVRELPRGDEVVRQGPPFTVDLSFTLTVASNRATELLNLVAAVAAFLRRNLWLEMDRDPNDASLGVVRWELDVDGPLQMSAPGAEEVRAFSWGLIVRGFDLDEGQALEVVWPTKEPTALGVAPLARTP